MITIAIMNQKGGVGKTTTSLCLSEALALRNKRVLAVDMEPQHNLSNTKKVDTGGVTSMTLLQAAAQAGDAIQHAEHMDVIAGTSVLSTVDSVITDVGKEFRMKEALSAVQEDYDFCIIDTPPQLGTITINALTACDYVIIPAAADMYSIEAIGELYSTFQVVWKYCNRDFKILGILITRYKAQQRLTRQALDSITAMAKGMGTRVFDTKIRESVAVAEAQTKRMSLFDYARYCTSARDYWNLSAEVLKEIEKNGF